MGFLTAEWMLKAGIAGWIILSALLLWGIGVFLSHYCVKFWLRRKYPTAGASEVTVILPSVDWKNPIAWIKPNFDIDDIKIVLAHIECSSKKAAIYNGPDAETVERLMRDKTVREVYFIGHGGTNFFRLGTEEVLCYCLFNDPEKYSKDFVHQVHCGSSSGKSLIDYVVPEKNREKCFFVSEKIQSKHIKAGFQKLAS